MDDYDNDDDADGYYDECTITMYDYGYWTTATSIRVTITIAVTVATAYLLLWQFLSLLRLLLLLLLCWSCTFLPLLLWELLHLSTTFALTPTFTLTLTVATTMDVAIVFAVALIVATATLTTTIWDTSPAITVTATTLTYYYCFHWYEFRACWLHIPSVWFSGTSLFSGREICNCGYSQIMRSTENSSRRSSIVHQYSCCHAITILVLYHEDYLSGDPSRPPNGCDPKHLNLSL